MNIQTLKTIVLGLVLAIGIQYAAAWTNPKGPAPTENVATPINIGSVLQQKEGSLAVNTSLTNPYTIGLTVFGKIQIVDGTQGAGKVLVSDENGAARWVATSSLGLGEAVAAEPDYSHVVVLTGSGNWTVPSGVTKLRVTITGAGGGGGGGSGWWENENDYSMNGGTGGSSGGYVYPAYFTVTPGQSLPYSVGQGGAGGASYSSAGQAGGNTTFNGIGAKGGGGGSSSVGAVGTVDTGQTALHGTVTYTGFSGTVGESGHFARKGSSYGGSGKGGTGYPSSGGNATAGVRMDNPGTGWGAGGGGAMVLYSSTGTGGKGSDGTIIVEY